MEYNTIISLTAGTIGSVTGVVSLIWHIANSKPKLIIKSLYFEKGGFNIVQARSYEHIGMNISFRNKGKSSTTVEKIFVTIANRAMELPFFQPITIEAGSSMESKYVFNLTKSEYDQYINNKEVEFLVFIPHTFGKISKKGVGSLETTGYFNLVS